MKKRILALTLALFLLLSSCGGEASAATMHLRKAKGTVGVSDSGGKGVEPRENLGLYSGYEVDTQAESYAWIDLDNVKLIKLDEDSEIAITKEGKKLDIEVKAGSLFFNVTQPLADDESMNIRTSTMAVGIRGTCGWVTQDAAALLEGTVEVTAVGQAVTISAGEMAVLTEDGTLEVVELFDNDLPVFVREELENDEEQAAGVDDGPPQDQSADADDAGTSSSRNDLPQFVRITDYGPDGTLRSKSETTYADDSLINIYSIWMDGQWVQSARDDVTYDERGIWIESRSYSYYDSSEGQLNSITRLEEETDEYRTYRGYDVDGNINEETIYHLDEEGQVVSQESDYYDADGTLLFHDSTDYNSSGWTSETQNLSSGTSSIYQARETYDDQGQIVREDVYQDGVVTKYSLYEYEP